MASRFGPNGDRVEACLDDLRTTGVDWREFVESTADDTVVDAVEAVGYSKWPVAIQSATFKAATDAFASLGLTAADLPGPLDLAEVRNMIVTAAKVLALGDAIPADHRTAILRPFADVGLDSARAAIADA
ncbi:hypothetical protein [Cellulomonas fimi]|uniref:hypothetical protein n=1 Tax=Cellulomonas fimi TaxID=1708 RepID=UPI0002E1E42B|nr:hypothetical protein [Cellulomonas fimi]NNH08201.1 hypothetical protein [Cellulomonas fimi]VEH34659.1 Uncharacterised protein [Cellulomonas fimi]